MKIKEEEITGAALHYSNCIHGTEYTLSIEQLENNDYYEDININNPQRELHLSQVVVNAGGKIYVINEEGIKEVNGYATGRGCSVFIQYADEESSVFETQLQFHKGYLFKRTEKIAEQFFGVDEDDEYELRPLEGVPIECVRTSDIWRD